MERRIHVPPEVDIEVVYIPPQGGGPRNALDEALAAFERVRARAVETQYAQTVAAEAVQLVQAANLGAAG